MRALLAPMEWGMTKEELKHAGTRCAKKKPHIIALTEMRTTAMKVAFMSEMPARYKMTLGGECPIVYDSTFFEFVDIDWFIATKGLKDVTPNLPITRVGLRVKKTRKRIDAVVTHLVPLSLNGKRREDHRKERQRMWDEHYDEVIDLLKGTNVPTVVLGDFNNRWFPKARLQKRLPAAKWLVKDSLDWIFLIPRRHFSQFIVRWTVHTGSDHLGQGVTFRLK